jgi:hypothetical protein
MDTENATQLSNEFQSALSEILPDLHQLLQEYKISETLKIDLESGFFNIGNAAVCTCCLVNGGLRCGSAYQAPGVHELALGLDNETAESFCQDISLKLRAVVPSIKQADMGFGVHLSIDPFTVNNEQSVVCKWGDEPQGHILHCSSSCM